MVYWSGTGNTEMMAMKIQQGLIESGVSVDTFIVDEIAPDNVTNYDKILFGCPYMGVDELEETEFEPFFEVAETLISGKKVALFGSFGWGDGEWMDIWEERVLSKGAVLFNKGLIANYTPNENDEDACVEFGKAFAQF
jgi:flavodoxin short chain